MSNISRLTTLASAGSGDAGAWDLSYSQYALTGYEWQGRGSYVTSSALNSTAISVQYAPLFLKPDGTKLWVAGRNSQDIYEFNLSTPFYAGGLYTPAQTH